MTIYAKLDANGYVEHMDGLPDAPDMVGPPTPPPDDSGDFQRVTTMPGQRPNRAARLALVNGAGQWVDARSLDDAQAQAWALVKDARTAAELAPFEFEGGLYDADVSRVSGAALNALMAQLAGVPFAVDWTLADNTVRTLTGAQMQACGLALAQHIEAAFSTARALRAAIAAAESPAAADEAATWPTPTEEPNV